MKKDNNNCYKRKMTHKYMEKRGQIALWVILALAIVGFILVFVTFGRNIISTRGAQFNPQQMIEACVSDAVDEAVNKMLPQGGFINPTGFKMWNNTHVEYLCVSTGYYTPCTNMHPMFLNEMREEIKTYINPRVEQCFDLMQREAEKRNKEVEIGKGDLSINLAPNRVFVNIPKKVTIRDRESTTAFEKIDVEVINPIYDLGNVAIEIANQQVKYCYFDHIGYSISNQDFNIGTDMMSDSTRIYMIEYRESGKILKIAIRSCAFNAGLV
jgi:hypothetical protein